MADQPTASSSSHRRRHNADGHGHGGNGTSSRGTSRPGSAAGPDGHHGGSSSRKHHGSGHGKSSKPPVRIGQYTIQQTLGAGSFGKVKLATHSLTGHRVAMKIINRRKISSLDMGGRVKREIQYLKLLRHPHIIKLYEVITTPSDIIMVIEYAGGELFQYIVDRGRMSEDEARRFFQQIIAAIEYCHRHKIVHRDLKPENLFLDDHLNVKIGDFGLSNIMTDGDFLKTSCGSPNYAAPEVISGKLYAGPEIDIWSCGVILYVMLCGRLPFDDDYIPTLFKKINGGIYTLPSYLSQDAKQLLSSMLVVDPVKRITIAEIRQSPWFQKDLPSYLQPLPPTPAATDTAGFDFGMTSQQDGGDTDKREENDKGPRQAIAPGIGYIEPEIVKELTEKMIGFSIEDIRGQLFEQGENQVKVAYQLVRDQKRMLQAAHLDENSHDMQSFLAHSPPPWNAGLDDHPTRSTSIKRRQRRTTVEHGAPFSDTSAAASSAVVTEGFGDETMMSEQELDNATDDLTTTEAGPSDEEDSATDMDDLFTEDDDGDGDGTSKPIGVAILETSIPGQRQDLKTPISEAVPLPAVVSTKRGRSRWHFGIRSRSPPMEIMLELYRTLQVLGMEWREKPVDRQARIAADRAAKGEHENGHQDGTKHDEHDDKADTNTDDEGRHTGKGKGDKGKHGLQTVGEELYFIETRWIVNQIVVRMNLQLYRVDEANYLVDFRHVGYTTQPAAEERSKYRSGSAPAEASVTPSLPGEDLHHGSTQLTKSPESNASPTAGTDQQALHGQGKIDDNTLHAALEQAYQQSGNGGALGLAPNDGKSTAVSGPATPRHATIAALPEGRKDVNSPFLFLECATRLIIELAGGG